MARETDFVLTVCATSSRQAFVTPPTCVCRCTIAASTERNKFVSVLVCVTDSPADVTVGQIFEIRKIELNAACIWPRSLSVLGNCKIPPTVTSRHAIQSNTSLWFNLY